MHSLKPILFFCLFIALFLQHHAQANENDRLIILADMGNEPDEEQQMIHMLVCSNEFDLEGLIAVTGKWLRNDPRDDLFFKLIDGYEKVYSNLLLHSDDYPEPDYLRKITVAGQSSYGMEDVGKDKSSEGSELILNALTSDDPRPVWIVVNAGSNTLAQALFDYRRNHSSFEVTQLIEKIRVFENGSQDNAGAWICSEFPNIHWIRSNYQTYSYGGPGSSTSNRKKSFGPNRWQPYANNPEGQHEWLKENVMENHGPLGNLYPIRIIRSSVFYMEGGGTIPWLGLVNKGLFDINHPSWGGWGGRFTGKKVADFWSRHDDIRKDEKEVAPFYTYREVSDTWENPKTGEILHNEFVPVWRWREAFYNNFKCRMDWCVKDYENANHHPVAAISGNQKNTILKMNALAGETLEFDASMSYDPDGDELEYNWWIYQEAGTYPGTIPVRNHTKAKSSIEVPSGAGGKQIHLILEVKDNNPIASLYDYRRIVINVNEQIKYFD